MDKNKWKLLLTGGAVGLVNGFLGGGGGVFAVVALTMFLGLPQKNAHATALLVILPVSVVSAAVYIFSVGLDVWQTLAVTAGVTAGGVLGSVLLKKADNEKLRLVFGFILILAGARMFF